MNRMMSVYCRKIGDISQIQTVMLDRDYNEIQAVCDALSDADVLLCKFHVLKYFKKKVSELVIPVPKKNELFSTLIQLVYVHDATTFDASMSKLEEKDACLFQYVSDNWL